MHLGFDDNAQDNLMTGVRVRRLLLSGTAVIQAVSANLLESESLGFLVSNLLWTGRQDLQRMGFFQVGVNPGVGAPGVAGDLVQGSAGDEMFATAVTLPFFYPWNSREQIINAPVLGSIDAVLKVRTNSPVEGPSYGQGQEHSPFGAKVSAPGVPSTNMPSGNNPARSYSVETPRRYRRLPLTLADVRVSPVYPPAGPTKIKV